MSETLEKLLVAVGGGASTGLIWLVRAWYASWRRGRGQASAEEIMRKELWEEIRNLRKLLAEASSGVIESQAKYLSLLMKHENLLDELSDAQERMSRIGELLTSALGVLGKIETVQSFLTGETPNLLSAQQELQYMKIQANAIVRQSSELKQLAV